MEELLTIDVVIPSIRLDALKMLDALEMDVPLGVDVKYYIISDNPKLIPSKFIHNGCHVTVMVNKENLGAPLSRNVGLEAGMGRYILFIDDDVTIPPDILYTYLDAIKKYPNVPGYIGPTIFPKPVNSFTRGIVASGMLTFFEIPAGKSRLMSWGTTSNLMVRRDSIDNVRFSGKFPKHGGGEDVDFCIRISINNKMMFRTIPLATAHHPWWNDARRSYRRFFRWSFGDSQLVKLYPQYTYYDVPDIVESVVIGGTVLVCMALADIIPPVMVGIWAGLAICSEFVIEQFQVRSHHPKSHTGAAFEAAIIRISSQMGRFFGPLSRKSHPNICRRFDYITTGEWIISEKRFSGAKFALFCVCVPIAYLLGTLLG